MENNEISKSNKIKIIVITLLVFIVSAFQNNQLASVTVEGKSSSSDFTTYGRNIWGWASGYSDSNIVWTGSN